MKKLFTLALAAAFTANAAQAQVLKYGAEAGETAPDTVNWYGEWVNAGGTIEFNNSDAATGEGAIYVNTPEEAGAANDWERVLKFDGLKIKENTNYRVRVSAKAGANAIVGLALMCGDENCDMPFVLPTSTSYYSQKKDVTGFNEADYSTKAALFRYTTDAYQQEIYPNVKADDKNPLGANRFLRLTVKSVGEYYLDDIIVEEAAIAACYNGLDAVKVDFGFSTNIAALVKANGGVVTLDPSCAKIKVNGAEVAVEAVELREDGNLYIFPETSFTYEDVVLVSFDATNSGITYSGEQTPGDGVAVPSFTDEASYLDESIEVVSSAWEEPRLVSSNPKNYSFELDENIDEFTFTFDKDIFVSGKNAPVAIITGGNLKNGQKLGIKDEGKEISRSITFEYNAALPKGEYTITVSDVQSSKEVAAIEDFTLTFETGSIAVADIEYTDYDTVDVKGENGNHSENWTSYFNGEEVVPAGGGIRMFTFPADGKYTSGFYLSPRELADDTPGATLTYGEKEDAPLELPNGDVQINILASLWQADQGKSGNFTYELLNSNGDVVASGAGIATAAQNDQSTPANNVSKISFNVEGCTAGKYVFRITTKGGGYGTCIIVWGLDIKTYKVGQGETADNQIVVDGSFTEVGNDCTPDQGKGWTIYEIKDGAVIACEKGSTTGIGQRARFFVYSNVPNLPVAYYNRNMGGDAETSYYMTYGETGEPANEEALYLDDVRYSFSWYCVNWKGDNNRYVFQIIDVEEGNEIVYTREDYVTANVNGSRDAKVEPYKVEFKWTPSHYGQYMLKWFMDGESSLGNIKVEQMGSQAAYWHTQLNNAIASAEAELSNAAADQYAGTTRDNLSNAIKEAKTVVYHTGEEYTEVIENLEQLVKAMAERRGALSDYDGALANLTSQIESMTETKYENLTSYTTAVNYVTKYADVPGYTIENDVLLPLVEDMQTLYTLNTNLMAANTGVAVLTDQVVKLANAYVKLDEIVNGEESIAVVDDIVIAAQDETVTDDQALAGKLKLMVTGALYKAINKGYNFEELEYPDEEPSEDNVMVPTALDLSGFIRNSVFYATTAKNQPTTQETSDGTMPGWTFNAPNGYAADWGWGGWSNNNQPVEPLNLTNSMVGTRWACDVEVYQELAGLPVGIYSLGGYCTDRSYVTSDNVLEEGQTTPSYIYVKLEGKDDLTKPFDVTEIGQYYGMTETLIDDVTIEPAAGDVTGKATLGANIIFAGSEPSANKDGQNGFAGFDNATLKMSAKHPTFDYAAAIAKIDEAIANDIKVISNTDANIVNTQYFDLNGRKVVNAKGVLIRIDTMSDGSQKAVKVLRR